jgi:hypothetical protein
MGNFLACPRGQIELTVLLSLAPIKRLNDKSDVRFWPKADIPSCTAHVRFGGKADMAIALRNVRDDSSGHKYFTKKRGKFDGLCLARRNGDELLYARRRTASVFGRVG